ncbi:hypothetical protein [Actinophytocola sp.]|uniref:hypothetical protein n=1 Tax=Actinophytocola sp. TaxID=1872138 RepID=UPI002ED57B6E
MRRRILTVLGLVVVVGGTALAWYVAAGARTPGQRAAAAAPPPPSVITAEVTGGELVDSLTLPGVFARANTVPVLGPAAVATGKAVVTALPVAAGAQVGNGTLVAEVSGRPLILLTGSFPAYRDLAEGDAGPDVTQLQTALKAEFRTPVTGVFDKRTAADVRKLYARVKHAPVVNPATPPDIPETVRLPAAEVAFVPELPATVGTLGVRVGDDANAALLTLVSGPWQVVAAVPAGLEQTFTGAGLVCGAGAAQGKAVTLKAVRPGTEDRAPASGAAAPTTAQDTQPDPEAVFELEGDVPGAAAGQAQEIVVERRRSPPGSLIVPASALVTRADGTVEVTVVSGGARRVVPVEVVMSHQGQVAVTGGLAVGDKVVVGG